MIYKPLERLRRAITLRGKHVIHFAGTMLIKPFLSKGVAVPRSGDTAIRRILYVNMAFRGDLILSFPALTAIRSQFPRAEITCWVRAYNVGLARLCQAVDEVITYDRFHANGLLLLLELLRLRRHRSFLEDLRSRRFDIMIDDSGFGFSALAGFLTGIPLRIGRNTQGYGFLYHREVAYGENVHLVRKRLDLLKLLNIETSESNRARIIVTEERARLACEKLGIGAGEHFFTVQPYAGWDAKNWEDSKIAEVTAGFARLSNLRPVLIGGASDQQRIESLRETIELVCYSTAGMLELEEALAMISSSEIHFGVDSVSMHMAAAVGIKSVTLFGPTNPLLLAPLSKNNIAIVREISCSPQPEKLYCARDAGRMCPRYICMESLEAQEVLSILTRHWQGLIQEQIVRLPSRPSR